MGWLKDILEENRNVVESWPAWKKEAVTMEHYTENRRWSYIHNAWIFADGWNEQEEIAALNYHFTQLIIEKQTIKKQLATVQAERDAMAEKVKTLTAWYDKMLGTPCEEIRHQQQVERLEAERDALKTDNERLQAEILALDLLPHTQKLKRLEHELAQARQERDSWHQIVRDYGDEDEQFRKVAGEWDKSDSYGVESHAEILEKVLKQLHDAQAREGRLREALEHLHDTQNGPPLEKYRLSWEEAMQKTEEALKEAQP